MKLCFRRFPFSRPPWSCLESSLLPSDLIRSESHPRLSGKTRSPWCLPSRPSLLRRPPGRTRGWSSREKSCCSSEKSSDGGYRRPGGPQQACQNLKEINEIQTWGLKEFHTKTEQLFFAPFLLLSFLWAKTAIEMSNQPDEFVIKGALSLRLPVMFEKLKKGEGNCRV